MKLSIIVPVYNADKYLKRCIDSILSQTISDFEVILIDDGSEDSSPQICDDYAHNKDNVMVVHQKNQGVSVARNVGLKNASGEYIGFVDADDYIHPEMYKTLLNILLKNNSEIALCDNKIIREEDNNGIETIDALSHSIILSKNQLEPNVLLEIAGGVCRCVYKAKLLKEYSLQFPTGLKISEDRIFNLYSMGYAEKIAYVKEPLYFRTLNDESAVHRYHADYPAIVERGRVATVEAIEQAWGNNPVFQNCYKRQYVEGCLNAIENEKRIDAHHSFWRRYREIRSICSNPKLTEAITSTNYQKENLKCRWILQKRYFTLSLKNQKIFRKADSVMSQIRKDGICNYLGRLAGKVFKWQ